MKDKTLKFRIVEITTYGNKTFFIPQIIEMNSYSNVDDEEEWLDIDFDGEEYNEFSEGNGDLKCESLTDAQKVIDDYVKIKEEDLKDEIKTKTYHEYKPQ